MQLNRADMKLLVEAGYSGVMRNIDSDVTPIFDALDEWLPENTAGPVGLALQMMITGRYGEADALLTTAMMERSEGKSEASAILAMCKSLQNDMPAAEQIARDLEGEGSSAEVLAAIVVSDDADFENAAGSQEPAHAATG